MTLERITDATPAFENGTTRGSTALLFTARDQRGSVTLRVFSGWWLPETPNHVRTSLSNRPWPSSSLHWHAPWEFYASRRNDNADKPCPDGWPVCYDDIGYGAADGPMAALVREGGEAMWLALEAAHAERLGEAS